MSTDPKKTPHPRIAPYFKHIAVLVVILAAFFALVLYGLPGFMGDGGLFGQNGSTLRTGQMGDNPDVDDTGKGNGDVQEEDSGSQPPAEKPGNGQRNNPVPSQGTAQTKSPIPVPPIEDNVEHIGTPSEKTPQAKNEAPQNVSGTGLGRDGRGFFGKKLNKNENIWFIIDLSSSMGASMNEGITRIEALKIQLLNAIETMHREGSSKKYCIQPFGNSTGFFPDTAPKKMTKFKDPMDPVKQYVNGLGAFGGTPMMHAWKTALSEMQKADVPINAIYFLSDGEPTDCCPVDLLNYLKTHVPKTIKVYTFAIGQQSPLMEAIAKQHGGVCITAL